MEENNKYSDLQLFGYISGGHENKHTTEDLKIEGKVVERDTNLPYVSRLPKQRKHWFVPIIRKKRSRKHGI